ncbi:hypothetical protein TNCV_1915321 [Trichonephila clavipes]|uniref:Uncharacterized protein n=1 Tax=Trichonephila clavipes TaxID=2585209 RepID=A0A8X6W0I0_TRICX|nr:hypothetical protein TNCV_1915321 [Trichonephila clavipes]
MGARPRYELWGLNIATNAIWTVRTVNTATNVIWTVNICVCISLDTYLPVRVEGSSTKEREKRRKEGLINVLKEIGEQATSKETIIQLKTKLEKSAAFKDDPDYVINLLNLSVEDRQARAEQQLQETNSQLELEKIKLQQIEREVEFQKTLAEGQATQQSSKGDTNNLENLIKSAKTLTIQIPTKAENFGLFFPIPRTVILSQKRPRKLESRNPY